MNKKPKITQDETSPEDKLEIFNKRLEEAEKNAGLGSWEFNCQTGKIWWSKQLFRLFNLDATDEAPSVEDNISRVHPEDRHLILEVFEKMSKGELPPTPIFRSNPEFGPVKYFKPTVSIEKDDNGNPLFFRGTQLDITESHLADKAFRESEELYRLIADNSTDVIWIIDLNDWKYLYISPAVYKQRGFTPEEILAGSVKDAMTDESFKKIQKIIPTYVEYFNKGGQDPFVCEIEQPIKSGGTIINELKAKLYKDNQTGHIIVTGSSRNVTERKRAEDEIKARETLFKAIFNSSPDDITITDLKGNIKMLSPAGLKIFGYEQEFQVIGKNVMSFIHPSEQERAKRSLQKLIEGSEITPEEYICVKSNGETIYSEIIGNFINDSDGNPIGIIFNLRDITARKKTFDKQREMDMLINSIFSSAAVGMGIISNRIFVKVNKHFLDITGYTEDELINKNARILYCSEEDYINTGKELYGQIEKNTNGLVETVWKRKNGKAINILLSGARMKNDPKEISFTAYDITEKKNAEKTLLESEKKYRTYINNAPIGLVIFDSEGKISENNSTLSSLLGYRSNELVGMRVTDMLTPENAVEGYGLLSNLKTGKYAYGDVNITRKNGDKIWLEVHAVQLSENKYMGYGSDITERKKNMEKLIQFKESVEQSVDGIAISDMSGITTYINKAWGEMHGYTQEEVIGKHISIFHSERQQKEELPASVKETQTNGHSLGELGHVRKDGTEFPTFMTTSVLFDDKKIPFGMVAVSRDITDLKRQELVEKSYIQLSDFAYGHTFDELIQKTLDVAESLTESSIGFYHFVDDDQKNLKLQTWSTNTLNKMCTAEGKGVHYPIDSAGVWADCIRFGKPIIHNDYNSLKNKKGLPEGHANVARELIIPIYRNDKAVAIMGVGNKTRDYDDNDLDILKQFADLSWDVIVRKQKEDEIIKINEQLEHRVTERTFQLEAANKDLEAFAYSVSHDLRAPLRHIDGFTKILQSSIKEKDEETDSYFDRISESARKMAKMIDDLLSFSRLGRKSINISDVDLNIIVNKVIKFYNPDASERNIEWILKELPVLQCDSNLIQLVFENLITNAIKYTSKKEKAVIEIGTCDKFDGKCIFIKDNGAGFDMKYADKLFGVFQRLHSSEEFEGTGIGLANIKQIINKHGWSIHAEGEVGKGAVFYIKYS